MLLLKKSGSAKTVCSLRNSSPVSSEYFAAINIRIRSTHSCWCKVMQRLRCWEHLKFVAIYHTRGERVLPTATPLNLICFLPCRPDLCPNLTDTASRSADRRAFHPLQFLAIHLDLETGLVPISRFVPFWIAFQLAWSPATFQNRVPNKPEYGHNTSYADTIHNPPCFEGQAFHISSVYSKHPVRCWSLSKLVLPLELHHLAHDHGPNGAGCESSSLVSALGTERFKDPTNR